jgi:TatD DNase family protein
VYELIDTHAHLDEIENLAPVLAGARRAGVVAVIAVGVDMSSNEKVLRLAGEHPGLVYPALGFHPWNIDGAEIDKSLEFIAAHVDGAVAVGEIGLDYHKRVRAKADKDVQKRVFGGVLKIARACGKPALVHSRYAWRDALDAVVAAGVEKAVFHWYTGTSSVLRDIISRGYYISATPAVEYHEEHHRAVKEVPLDRLLLETDAPVVYRRGSPEEFEAGPADVVRSLRGAAVLRGVGEAEMARATTANARGFFGLEKVD